MSGWGRLCSSPMLLAPRQSPQGEVLQGAVGAVLRTAANCSFQFLLLDWPCPCDAVAVLLPGGPGPR